MKTHYFTLTDEEGKTAGIVKAKTDREFESLVMDCTIAHYCVDDVSLETSLQMEWFKNHVKPQSITIACKISSDPVIHYDIKIEHTVVYENKVQESQNVTINRLELSSELADKKLNDLQQEELKNNNAYYPNGIVKENENGDVIYTEEAQDDFNQFYSEYSTIIEQSIIEKL